MGGHPSSIYRLVDRRTKVWLARLNRSRSRATFVGVTGSSAKSSTTKMLSHILSGIAPVYAQVLANTFLSCVDTLRSIRSEHEYVVSELASGGPGTLQPKIGLLRPSVGVVTLVALEHYARFRSLEAVAEEKGKLVESLPKNGLAILNHDDPLVLSMAQRTRARVVTFGRSGGDFRIAQTRLESAGKLKLVIAHQGATFEIETRLTGLHNSLAVAASFACSHQLGVPPQIIKKQLASFEPIFGRCSHHVIENGPIFILDTAKAPFHSILLPISMMAEINAPRRRIVIGHISDFAGNSRPKYRDVYRAARKVADQVIFVGEHSHRSMATDDDIALGRFVEKRGLEEAAKFLRETAIPGEVILLKSASGLHLERVFLSFQHRVRCWEKDCGMLMDCTRCGSFAIPFAQKMEMKAKEKRERFTKPSRWEGWLVKRLPGVGKDITNAGSVMTKSDVAGDT